MPPAQAAFFIRDRAAGTTEQVDVRPTPVRRRQQWLGSYSLSADGRTIAFTTPASNLTVMTTDTNTYFDSYVRGPDPSDPNGVDTLFENESLTDNVLEVVDATSGAVAVQCPAGEVSVAGGVAAYLRPESNTGGTPSCPAGSLNVDEDSEDRVVQLVVGGGSTQNLGLARRLSARRDRSWPRSSPSPVSPRSVPSVVLNGDGDTDDDVVESTRWRGASWTNTHRAGDFIAAVGTASRSSRPRTSREAT